MVQNENKHTFINFLTRKGKKGKIEKLHKQILVNLKHTTKLKTKPTQILNQVVTTLKPKVQVKALSRFKTTIQPMKPSRQSFTALKWLTEKALMKSTHAVSTLTTEINQTLGKTSPSYLKKMTVYQEAQKLKFTLRRQYKKKP